VVAADLTPEHFEAGRREARRHGVELEWVRAVADELRVCCPGGVIGMINFTPEGLGGEFFELFGRYGPAPEGPAPVLWGSEEHVRELLGDRLAELDLTRRHYVERSPGGPDAYCAFFKQTFGPVIAVYENLAPARRAALDRDFLDFATRSNQAPPGAPDEYRYEYLLVVGTTGSARRPPVAAAGARRRS
jgi:hypothetical protein